MCFSLKLECLLCLWTQKQTCYKGQRVRVDTHTAPSWNWRVVKVFFLYPTLPNHPFPTKPSIPLPFFFFPLIFHSSFIFFPFFSVFPTFHSPHPPTFCSINCLFSYLYYFLFSSLPFPPLHTPLSCTILLPYLCCVLRFVGFFATKPTPFVHPIISWNPISTFYSLPHGSFLLWMLNA